MRLTNCESWAEAQELYLSFAIDEKLKGYCRLNLKKSIPQSFSDFSQRAKLSASATADNVDDPSAVIMCNGVYAAIIEAKPTEISAQNIQASTADFQGANLAIAVLKNESFYCLIKTFVTGSGKPTILVKYNLSSTGLEHCQGHEGKTS